MHLVTFSYKNRTPRVGILEGDRITQSAWAGNMLALVQSGVTPQATSERFPLADCTLKAPLRPGKIICVGRNYAEHAKELGNEVPPAPLLFFKATTSIIGTGEAITWQADFSAQIDWEGELAVVIGARARSVSEAQAQAHIFGYTIANDVSARDLQASEPQWARAKSLDTFCPLGPVIATRASIADPHTLRLQTTVNGQTMQDGNTGDMIHRIPALVAYCSRWFTLEPGDIILTGTPSGVGKGMNPPRFLGDGDEVSVSIEGIGTLTNPCRVLRA